MLRNLQEKLEKEDESAKADAAGTSSAAAGQSSSAQEPDVNQDHLRQVRLCNLSFWLYVIITDMTLVSPGNFLRGSVKKF